MLDDLSTGGVVGSGAFEVSCLVEVFCSSSLVSFGGPEVGLEGSAVGAVVGGGVVGSGDGSSLVSGAGGVVGSGDGSSLVCGGGDAEVVGGAGGALVSAGGAEVCACTVPAPDSGVSSSWRIARRACDASISPAMAWRP